MLRVAISVDKLSVKIKPIMLIVIGPSVTIKLFMLSVVVPSVIMPSVMASDSVLNQAFPFSKGSLVKLLVHKHCFKLNFSQKGFC
jgi:hypothetical protein